MLRLLILVFIFSKNITIVWASNELRELEYAEEIQSSFSMGLIVWLNSQKDRFLNIYTETEKKQNLGTAIILHPMDGHPDQRKLINPLRTYLPQHN